MCSLRLLTSLNAIHSDLYFLFEFFVDRPRNVLVKDAAANGLLGHRYVLSSLWSHWVAWLVHLAVPHWEQLVWLDRQLLI